ncbi:hypothetical protein [Dellaglioa algida]|uniref:hypothetical protein n=1 Tax=Dellaglioa algida TaxID=105612 RepID=UPI000BC728F7|nr:hypothetical protein [Dellaglioa algida]MDK1719184.1 hypothetical protein [Dellaglioa algida]MDK1728948.1 hypothetical protein [Dellaglioa algida]MDK1741382.1 hypothetical protein [Dellaglioa algida]SOB50117.1 conserved hypothetical protein [Dellaglioa algida]
MSLRILFHETPKSVSVFSKLKPLMHLYSSGRYYLPDNLLPSWVLLSIKMSNDGIAYEPLIDSPSRTFFMNFEDWWNEIIFDDLNSKFTRKDIILFVANQDGGTHVDPDMKESFVALTKLNSLGWVDQNGNVPKNNPVYQSIRSMARELIMSINLSRSTMKLRTKRSDSKIEMKFIDNNKRYKRTFTGGKSKKNLEKRVLYLETYTNGSKIEFID